MTPHRSPDEILGEVKSIAGEDNVRLQMSPARPDMEVAVVTVYPAGAPEVGAIIRWARQAAVPVFVREPGAPSDARRPVTPTVTSLKADTASTATITISLERLKNIRHLDRHGLSLLAEPGATVDEVRREARRAGAFCPAGPQASGSCFIGRCARCTVDDCLTDYIHGLEVVLATGELSTIGGGGTRDLDEYQLAYLLARGETPSSVITGVHLKLHPGV